MSPGPDTNGPDTNGRANMGPDSRGRANRESAPGLPCSGNIPAGGPGLPPARPSTGSVD